MGDLKRNSRAWINVVLPAALAIAGCHFPSREGPVSPSVADCRRLSRQGVGEMERGRLQVAESLLSKAVAACPNDIEARRNYAEALWRSGAKTDAMAQLEAAEALSPEDAAIWTRLAEMRLAAGQLETAWQAAERALDLDGKSPRAWAVRGGVRRASGRPREALDDMLRALGQAPNDRDVLMEVADLYRQLNEHDRSLQTLQTLAETYAPGEEPGSLDQKIGLTYAAMGRHGDAAECLATAVKRGQPTAEMYYQLGAALFASGKSGEAESATRQALALEPEHKPSHDLLDHIEVARQPQNEWMR